MKIPHKCPVCDGTGLVSRPPGVAGDQLTWSGTGTAPYPCPKCDGERVLWSEVETPPTLIPSVFTPPLSPDYMPFESDPVPEDTHWWVSGTLTVRAGWGATLKPDESIENKAPEDYEIYELLDWNVDSFEPNL